MKVVNKRNEDTGVATFNTEIGKYEIAFDNGKEKKVTESTFKRWYTVLVEVEVEVEVGENEKASTPSLETIQADIEMEESMDEELNTFGETDTEKRVNEVLADKTTADEDKLEKLVEEGLSTELANGWSHSGLADTLHSAGQQSMVLVNHTVTATRNGYPKSTELYKLAEAKLMLEVVYLRNHTKSLKIMDEGVTVWQSPKASVKELGNEFFVTTESTKSFKDNLKSARNSNAEILAYFEKCDAFENEISK